MGSLSFTQQYLNVLYTVLNHGNEVNGTREILDYHFTIADPVDNLAVGIGRRLNLHIGYLEALQLIGGCAAPDLITAIQPRFTQYMDGRDFHGNYGMRTGTQMVAIADRLRRTPGTRQAVVTVWDPMQDAFVDGQHDYPCTLSLTFSVRNSKLHLSVTMRSNDAWLGLPYDVMQFTCLQQTMARFLGLDHGTYHHHAVSMHIYDRDVAQAYELRRNAGKAALPDPNDKPTYICTVAPSTDWRDVQSVARALLNHGLRTASRPSCEQPFFDAVHAAWAKK